MSKKYQQNIIKYNKELPIIDERIWNVYFTGKPVIFSL